MVIKMPSIAPKGWLETKINGPVLGILAKSSSKTIYFKPRSRTKESKKSFPTLSFKYTHTGEAIHIEEYAPVIIPIIKGIVNSLTDGTNIFIAII